MSVLHNETGRSVGCEPSGRLADPSAHKRLVAATRLTTRMGRSVCACERAANRKSCAAAAADICSKSAAQLSSANLPGENALKHYFRFACDRSHCAADEIKTLAPFLEPRKKAVFVLFGSVVDD